jgi:haloalkane dehalogenase
VLFLHGNPTSSYIWRNIVPLVEPVGHCVAPDLIGFGQSGKPSIEYRFFDHVRYLDAFLDKAGISAYIVAQDWGTALAFHLAARRPEFVRALAFMEFIRPMPTWDDFHPSAVETFKQFRTPGEGERIGSCRRFLSGAFFHTIWRDSRSECWLGQGALTRMSSAASKKNREAAGDAV